MRRLALSCWAFAVPKRGHTSEEFEDALALHPARGLFAVADGASESSFAALWGRLLVEGFTNPEVSGRLGCLKWLRRRWAEAVDPLELPWYAEAKRTEGAFATLLSLSVRPTARSGGTWHGVAVGDSCLFQVRAGALRASFPLAHARDFTNRPCLLGSRPSASSQQWQRRRGRWQPGDRFLLMTDALAQWFIQQSEQGEQPWLVMERLVEDPPALLSGHLSCEPIPNGTLVRLDYRLQAEEPTEARTPTRNGNMPFVQSPAFSQWIDELRNCRQVRNDDVTLLVVQL